jgi:hypothetical protein
VGFVAASSLGFQKRPSRQAQPIYGDLTLKMHHSDLVHADETYWRKSGNKVLIWYAGNEEVVVYGIDSQRSAEAAKPLLGERINGLQLFQALFAGSAS